MFKFIKTASLLSIAMTLSIQGIAQTKNWYQLDRTDSAPYNIGTDAAYGTLLSGKSGTPVIVAVIDSGVDVEHEDLKDVIWVNQQEIPNNGIDDDNNGYIDDIHGWNFIGGKDGSHVAADTYEMVRTYAKYKKMFKDVDPATLNKDNLKKYNDYIAFGERIENERKSAKKNFEKFDQDYQIFSQVLDHIKRLDAEYGLNEKMIDSLSRSFNQNDAITANIYNVYLQQTGAYPSYETLVTEILDPIQEGRHHFESKWKYNWNPNFDPRHIVGDNLSEKEERGYGNNSVEGPDAFHGTHVAGIIAARRNNKIGIDGVAQNVQIMVLRAVPDGDERDKDVANAIIYAVENGASVINMSFGKGESPYKQVVDDAIRFAEKKDVLIVHAAGNSGEDLTTAENYPNDRFAKPKGFLWWKKKKAKNYITIGANGPSAGTDLVAGFSNYGAEDVDIFAPGVAIISTAPDNKYKEAQGTSMAAPVVSGVAALIRSYYPTLTAEQVKDVLMESTNPIDTKVTKPGTQEMVPFSELSVAGGVVNVSAALKKAANTKGKKKIKRTKSGV